MNETIRSILNIAVQAPSGDNCQPWRFRIEGDSLQIFEIKDRDESLYNHNSTSTYIAHGALLENIDIAARYLGYQIEQTLFPPSVKAEHIATITFSPVAKSVNNDIFFAIPLRCTNRKPYSTSPLEEVEHSALSSIVCEPGVKIVLIADDRRKKIAKAVSANEELLFANKLLHNFFFEHITWDSDVYNEKRLGFPINSLEIPRVIHPLLKGLSSWSAMSILNALHFPSLIAAGNLKTYSSCAEMGAILLPATCSREDIVASGKVLERAWLTATSLGLNFQPLMGITLLHHALRNSKTLFSPSEAKIIRENYDSLRDIFRSGDSIIIGVFRVGKGGGPSDRTLRLAPSISAI